MKNLCKKVGLLFCALCLFGCDDLIIGDDGQVAVGLSECEHVSFTILVKQPGKPNVQDTKAVEDGILELDIGAGDYDFNRPITVEVFAVGVGAEACGIDGVRVFNGVVTPVGMGDHKISLGDFVRR